MSKLRWNLLKATPVILGTSLLFASSTVAAQKTTPENLGEAEITISEVTETSDLAAKATTKPEKAGVGLAASPNLDLETISLEANSDNLAAESFTPQTTELAQNTENNRELLQQINRYSDEGDASSLDQITNVNQLRDVSPSDWAYEALRNLVNNYGCIQGYPDGTYRGNRALTRYEFAAGLNACLEVLAARIREGGGGTTTPPVTEEDLLVLRRLIQEFEAELATLGTRVDDLEARVAFLEDNQFSTTTKLRGEVIFSLAGAFGEDKAIFDQNIPNQGDAPDVDENIVLNDRVRLNFDTSFTGKDRLRVRLEAGNFTSFSVPTGTEMARLGYEADGGNNIALGDVYYRTPLGDNITFYLGVNATDGNDIMSPVNPYFSSSGTGALTRFGRFNPLIYRVGGDQAAALNIKFSDSLGLDLAYLTGDGESPAQKDGLFDGDYTALARLTLGLGDAFDIGLTYGHSFYPGSDVNLSGSTGSPLAKRPFGNVATSANRYGVDANLRLGSRISLGGWVGYIDAEAEADVRKGDNADLWTWAVNLAFPDLGGEGNVLGVIFGMPPKATDVDGAIDDPDTSYLLEAQYRFKITDNILVTPGAYVIFNPNHNDNNDTVYVGVVRTTFQF
ncbi:MAG: iron uptake porin [Oscillatoria sp. PMC 1068.18]|nr:iron uptake porin [Oscillatoria sp. PMC 1076.18]MEC4989339.1 iron uptake porin [Oscillatoria sp. PMC 1068.18]